MKDDMKVAILAGGRGTRLTEETKTKSKAMVEIGGRPILWHIMMHYYSFRFREFVVALGYEGNCIKKWMQEYCTLNRNMTVKTSIRKVIYHDKASQELPDWIVHLIDTGLDTQTGGRIKRLAPWLSDQTFMLTWCDGVADIDLHALLRFHRSHGRLATLTSVRLPSRFGHLVLEQDRVTQFKEKPAGVEGWINGAFFVLEPGVFDYIEGDDTQWAIEPLERLARDGQLMAYRHTGFWQCMDTLRDKMLLEEIWQSGKAPWKTWKG
jgi:glucose-1-phosphate cytidylyltransferase